MKNCIIRYQSITPKKNKKLISFKNRQKLGENQYLSIKVEESFSGTCIECESDEDSYFQHLSLKEYFVKMRQFFKDIIDQLKNTTYLQKIDLIL